MKLRYITKIGLSIILLSSGLGPYQNCFGSPKEDAMLEALVTACQGTKGRSTNTQQNFPHKRWEVFKWTPESQITLVDQLVTNSDFGIHGNNGGLGMSEAFPLWEAAKAISVEAELIFRRGTSLDGSPLSNLEKKHLNEIRSSSARILEAFSKHGINFDGHFNGMDRSDGPGRFDRTATPMSVYGNPYYRGIGDLRKEPFTD